jgi:hypothetical protein
LPRNQTNQKKNKLDRKLMRDTSNNVEIVRNRLIAHNVMILIEIIDKKCKKQLSLLGDY